MIDMAFSVMCAVHLFRLYLYTVAHAILVQSYSKYEVQVRGNKLKAQCEELLCSISCKDKSMQQLGQHTCAVLLLLPLATNCRMPNLATKPSKVHTAQPERMTNISNPGVLPVFTHTLFVKVSVVWVVKPVVMLAAVTTVGAGCGRCEGGLGIPGGKQHACCSCTSSS